MQLIYKSLFAILYTTLFLSSIHCETVNPVEIFDSNILSQMIETADFSGLVSKFQNYTQEFKNVIETAVKEKFQNFNNVSTKSDPNTKYRTLQEKVINAGFRIETHKIVTEDRYILTAFRIPGKLGESPSIKKKPATLTHALIDDAYSWLMLNNTNNIAIKLAEMEYI